jgi:hypothetical protein
VAVAAERRILDPTKAAISPLGDNVGETDLPVRFVADTAMLFFTYPYRDFTRVMVEKRIAVATKAGTAPPIATSGNRN